MQEIVKDWVLRTASLKSETLSKDLDGSYLPVYIVACPKLHVVPKKWLEYRLRWCDKWAYEVSDGREMHRIGTKFTRSRSWSLERMYCCI